MADKSVRITPPRRPRPLSTPGEAKLHKRCGLAEEEDMRVVIVDRNFPETFHALALLVQRGIDTRLIWDRRHQPDRRRQVDPRRTSDRRRRALDAWVEHHWMVL